MVSKDDIESKSCSEKDCKQIEVPTEDELIALNTMRAIKERVREIKKRISNREGDAGEISELEGEMERLRTEWKEWENNWEDARRERMILLGHEEA